MDLKDAYGAISVAIGIFGILPYIFTYIKGQTKPHAFTWLSWSLLSLTQFLTMHDTEAGAGAWVFFVTVFTYLGIGLTSLKWGDRTRTRGDYMALGISVSAALILFFVNGYLTALLVAFVGDAFAFAPTIRKSWNKPHEENSLAYWFGALMYIFSFLALADYTFLTAFAPVSLVLLNVGAAGCILLRRRIITKRD